MTTKKKAEFLLPPNTTCTSCGGKGHVNGQYHVGGLFQSSYYDKDTCTSCHGAGIVEKLCFICSEKTSNLWTGQMCLNKNCKVYGLIAGLVQSKI